MFPLDSVYLGELQNIRIGHSKTTAGMRLIWSINR